MTRIGIMGCGTIFPAYVRGLARLPDIDVVRCADIVPERALRGHEEFGIPRHGGPADLFADRDIDVVVNLTWPTVHHDVTMAALDAGKHVYSEKVMATTLADARAIVERARSRGLGLGSAPDTFLGTWGATSRAAVDAGLLGEVIGGTAFVTHNRVEAGHPDPTFLFQRGAGPGLDRGPYYVTAMVTMLGPVAEVSGVVRWGPPTRVMTNPAARVAAVDVEVPTHLTAVLRFAGGAVVTVVFSNDVWANELPEMELYGTAGTLSLPDPNWFDGEVRLAGLERDAPWRPLTPVGEAGGERGMGVADLIASLDGAPQRTSPELALHVLEVLLAIEASSTAGRTLAMTTAYERPPAPEPAVR